MKQMTARRAAALVMTMMLVLMSFAACSSNSNNGESSTNINSSGEQNANASANEGGDAVSEETIEIVYQSWVTPNLTAEFYDSAIQEFEKQNPGIKVKRIQPPGNEGTPDNYLKTLLASGDFPDVIQNATTGIFYDAGALMEIPIDEDIEQINNYQTDFQSDGKLYNITATRQPQSLIFYNKKLFEDAGITSLPKSWAELEEVSAKLKEKGITPLLTAGDWTSGFTFSLLTSPTVYSKNPQWYTDRHEGKVRFTDSDWIESAKLFQDLVSKGYFNEGALSIDYSAVEQEFLKGNGAMYPMGIWFTAAEAKAEKDFEVGVFPVPTKHGQTFVLGGENGSSGFSISKNTKHADAALKFAKFMVMNPEVGKNFLAADALISNMKTPLEWDMTPLQREVFNLVKDLPPMVHHLNNKVGSMPVAGIQDQYNKVGQSILLNDSSAPSIDELMQSMDDYWDKNKK